MPASRPGDDGHFPYAKRFSYQNATFRELSRLGNVCLQPDKNPLAYFANVVCACAQIRVFHLFEDVCVFGNDMAPCPEGPAACAYTFDRL